MALFMVLAACNDGTGVSTGGTFVVGVGTEQFRVRIDDAVLTIQARRMMTGAEEQKIVIGQLDRGDGGVNAGYSWHMKPGTISFAETTIEVCDGRPGEVEANIDYWVDTLKQYCPWSGRFIRELDVELFIAPLPAAVNEDGGWLAACG